MTHFANDQPVLMLQWVLLGWHRYIFLQNLRRDEDPSKRQAIAYCISAFTFASPRDRSLKACVEPAGSRLSG
ncbi:unnamed protein product [Symbiodinium necroappetens]|uniref:Uncharacterized protein n=1 Tax=Symbiodinium necroappetens TaxID=1628268 RepID=A0A812Y2E2_9DINO|nr:unnamed protein product [Symbiodinium necroappetens]